jgi:hypothetical protein
MKKLIGLFIGLLLVIGLQAQTTGTTYTLAPGVTYYNALNYTHTGDWDATTLKDSIGGTSALTWYFAVNKSQLYYFQVVCAFDTVLTHARAAGNHVTVYLYGSIDKSHWTVVDSLQYHPTAGYVPGGIYETKAVQMADVATGVLWRFFKVTATGVDANTCSIIYNLGLKVGLRY